MKKYLSIVLAIIIVFICCSCSADFNFAKYDRYQSGFLDLFDTYSTVIAYDKNEQVFDDHFKQFHDKLEEYDKLYSIYNSYDDMENLCSLNQKAKDGPVKVDSRIIDLLEYCKYVYDLTDQKTNVCFGSVLSIWHDSREHAADHPEDAKLPDMDMLKQASQHTDFNDLVIDKENSTVYYADPMLKLDVGAVAKGYAVREVCKWANENLWTSAAISIGGNVCTFGYKNDDGKTLWNIGVENPDTSSEDYLLNVSITDLSVVTSGDYQRYFVVGGKKYCHIINPDTLMPSEYFSSVSVICKDSALGDALSTALFNMPIEDGQKLVDSMDDVEAVWVDTEYNKIFSSNFEQYIAKE